MTSDNANPCTAYRHATLAQYEAIYATNNAPATAPVGLPGLYSQVAEAVADAERQLADEVTDSHALAESLVHTLTQVRDLLAATLPHHTQEG